MTSQDTDVHQDVYQERYMKHQDKKKEQLVKIMTDRTSQRNYNGKEIDAEVLEEVLEKSANIPSSCNRQAVYVKVISERKDKEILSGLLVGGVGWVHRADKLILIFACKDAYKAPGEIDFMPYLDAGVALYAIQLIGGSYDIGMAYVNPNIREENKDYFNKQFNQEKDIYCGAIACGYYDEPAEYTEKKKSLLKR